jgi:hypothetical protein
MVVHRKMVRRWPDYKVNTAGTIKYQTTFFHEEVEMATQMVYQLLLPYLAPYGEIGNLLLQGPLVDSQRRILQELLRICMLSGRRGRQLSDLVTEIQPLRAGP